MEAKDPIQEKLCALGKSNPEEFRFFLRRMRKLFPRQATEALLLYIATHGLDAASQSITFWLSGDSDYINILLDPDGLSPEAATRAIAAIKDLDQQFLVKFVKATLELKSPPVVLRAVGLLPALGDYSAFIPWLRRLSQSSDNRIGPLSSRLLCELRPKKGVVEQQMQSSDPRVRATAIQAMWNLGSEDSRELFRSALADSNHRVVSNALVGLYFLGETQVIDDMIGYRNHKDHLFRAAMAWAMAYVKDTRAIPTLQELIRDPSLVVRKRAQNSLSLLQSIAALEPEVSSSSPEPVAAEPTMPTEETAPPGVEPPPAEPVDTFNFLMFR